MENLIALTNKYKALLYTKDDEIADHCIRLLDILIIRDKIATHLDNSKELTIETFQDIKKLDQVLRECAESIEFYIGRQELIRLRSTRKVSEHHWWWYLDLVAEKEQQLNQTLKLGCYTYS